MSEDSSRMSENIQAVIKRVREQIKPILLLLLVMTAAIQFGYIDLGFGWGYDESDQFYIEPDSSGDVKRVPQGETLGPTLGPEPSFRMNASKSRKCGPNCFVIQAYIKNIGNVGAENVHIEMTLFTGVYKLKQETRRISSLSPGERYSESTNLSLGPFDIDALRKNDCQLRSEITIRYSTGSSNLGMTKRVDCPF